jgi:GH18 family chitinase
MPNANAHQQQNQQSPYDQQYNQQQQEQQQPTVPQYQQQQQPQMAGNGRPNGNVQYGGQEGVQQTTSQQQQTNAAYNIPASIAPVSPHGTSKKIIGYYAGWQWYDRNKLASPSNMDFSLVQRVNYAFFQPDAMGNIYGTDKWGDPQILFGPYSSMLGGGVQKCSYDGPHEVNCAYHEHNSGLIYKAHRQGAEVYPSIGGWTLSDNFPVLSANPSSRDAFARNCMEIAKYHDFDGELPASL